MLSATDLAAMQATANASMDKTVEIYRYSLTQDGGGHVLKTFPTNWTLEHTVSGTLAQPTAGQLANYGYAIADVAAWLVRVPTGTDIVQGDRLVVGSQHLEVQIVLQPQSYQTSMLVLTSEVVRA